MDRRRFLRSGAMLGPALGLGAAAAAQVPRATKEQDAARFARESRRAPPVPHRKLRTTRLFRSPEGFPNALDASPEGLWIGEQRTSEGIGVSNNAYLVDWRDGRVIRKVRTDSKNTSGMAWGGGHLWMGANESPQGVFRTDLDGRTVSHRQIPLGFKDGGGCHGLCYNAGKLYINALRLRGILRVDAETWAPEALISYTFQRTHGLAWHDDAIWMVTGALNTPSIDDDTAGLARYDARTGQLLETAEFDQREVDPHAITVHDGVMYGCDARIHPLWPDARSPSSGYIFRIDFV